MRVKFAIYVFYIFLIKNILSDEVYDLDKYKRLNQTKDAVIFFNSNGFQIGDEIYIKIYGSFSEDYIDYKFIDTLEDLNELLNIYEESNYDEDIYYKKLNLITVDSNKHETVNDKTEIRYYTIKKKKSTLDGKEGKYLAIFTYMDGYYDIENTVENQGNSGGAIIVIICVVVVVVVIAAIIFIIYYCYKKKKSASTNQDVQNNNEQQVKFQSNVDVYSNNNNNNNDNTKK